MAEVKGSKLFDFSIDYAKARAIQLGGSIIVGASAFEAEDIPVRRDLSETQFNVGDKVKLPVDAASPQWINTPLTKGQAPVTRCLCEVTSTDGTVSVKELFLGTLMKSVQNRETKANVSVGGSIVDFTKGCVTKKQVWTKLFGKTLEITKSSMVPIIRRGFNGLPDRLSDTSVLTINVL